VKQQDHPFDFVQVDEIRTLSTQLLCTDEIPTTRRKRTAPSRHVEAIEMREPEIAAEERVGRLLKASIRACDDQRVRSFGSPPM
jgi:hypothetical protein